MSSPNIISKAEGGQFKQVALSGGVGDEIVAGRKHNERQLERLLNEFPPSSANNTEIQLIK